MSTPGGASSDAAAPSLTVLAASMRIPEDVAIALWAHLDVDPVLDYESTAFIPRELLDQSLEEFRTTALPRLA